jgi:hypothetical protein
MVSKSPYLSKPREIPELAVLCCTSFKKTKNLIVCHESDSHSPPDTVMVSKSPYLSKPREIP